MFEKRFYTRIRPHASAFLERISRFYELHIVTFGSKPYAQKIARCLDPDDKYFEQRIISRTELRSKVHKSRTIDTLFPAGDDELLVMIDDRSDVWEYSSALIKVYSL